MDSTTLFYAILVILVVQFALDLLLDYLNSKRFKAAVPNELDDVFDATEYGRSQEYKLRNYRCGLFNDGFSFLLTIGCLVFGGFGWLDSLVRKFTEDPIAMGILFFGAIALASSLIAIPFSWYQTFVIEEKFGFNKVTPKIFVTDILKGWLLASLLGSGILAAFIWFLEFTGSNFWLYAWGMFIALMLFMNLFYSKLIVPLFNKQTPLEPGQLKSAIENYAQKVGFELKHIFVIDGSKRSTKANAYFSGFGRQKQVTLFDTLIAELDEEEIVAVLAHEVGHYKRKHIQYNLLASILSTGITLFILSVFVNSPQMSMAIGVDQPSFHAGLIGFVLLYSPISTLTGLLMNMLSRRFEFEADDYAKTTYAAQPLITSLKKLSQRSLSNLTPHPAYVFMHYSHPPLIERIRNLKA